MSKYVTRTTEILSDDGFIKKVHEHVAVKLKKCPFCGGKAQSIETFDEEGNAKQIIKCSKCGAQTDLHDEIEQAADAWNRRV